MVRGNSSSVCSRSIPARTTPGHCGYVLEGEVSYEFENGDDPLPIGAGQGLMLPDGAGHRGRAGERGAKLFIIDRAG